MRVNLPFSSETDEAGDSPLSLLLALIFLTGGLLMAGYGFTQYQGQKDSLENAVNTTATVTGSNMRTDSSRRSSTDYQAEIEFEYSYSDESYSSDFIYPLDDDREFGSEAEAEEFLSDFEKGKQVDAYVNPSSPGKGFLFRKSSDQPLIFMLIGGLMTLAGGYRTLQRAIQITK